MATAMFTRTPRGVEPEREACSSSSCRYLQYGCSRPPAFGIGLDELLEVAGGSPVRAFERALDDLGDAEERKAAVEERLHGDLVRRVEGARVGASSNASVRPARSSRGTAVAARSGYVSA